VDVVSVLYHLNKFEHKLISRPAQPMTKQTQGHWVFFYFFLTNWLEFSTPFISNGIKYDEVEESGITWSVQLF
jgi:hypothetical protein